MSDQGDRPVGAILAGGAGTRIGGAKATVELGGRPLLSYPLGALRSTLGEVVVVAKADTRLPDVGDAEVWIEPDEPRHPLTGILHALDRAGGRPVLVCAADMPFVTGRAVELLLDAHEEHCRAVVPVCEGASQPLLALYGPLAADGLAMRAGAAGISLRDAVSAISPRLIEAPWPEVFFNVNDESDLGRAEQRLRASRR